MKQNIDSSSFSLLPDADAYDPIEDRLRANVRATIEAMFEEELADFLGRLRYGRGDEGAKGYRHGHRERQLTGTFGTETVRVPHARIESEAGKVTEWHSKALPRYRRLTRKAEALIAAVYLAGTNIRRVKRALFGLFEGAVSKDVVNVIRKLRLREKLPIRKIARRTGLSRNTIKKYLNSGTIEPSFATPDRPSKLDPFAEKLTGWLKAEAGKSRKQRRTLKQMHADLVKLGFTGSYGRVAAFARDWRTNRQREQQTTGRGTFVPLAFQPGEAFQFNWSEDYGHLADERTKLQRAHIKLSHSRAFLLRAYPLQTHEMLFDAHWHAFRVFGGVPERGIYDSEAWPPSVRGQAERRRPSKLVGPGKERQVNIRFLAMANHYVFEPEFCNPAAGWDCAGVAPPVRARWRRVRSRRTFRTPATRSCRRCRAFPTLPR